jgi:hypothetical protein
MNATDNQCHKPQAASAVPKIARSEGDSALITTVDRCIQLDREYEEALKSDPYGENPILHRLDGTICALMLVIRRTRATTMSGIFAKRRLLVRFTEHDPSTIKLEYLEDEYPADPERFSQSILHDLARLENMPTQPNKGASTWAQTVNGVRDIDCASRGRRSGEHVIGPAHEFAIILRRLAN